MLLLQGRIFLQCQVRARLIVIRRIGGKNSPQVRLAEDDHLVQALATQCAHQTFRNTILPRRCKRIYFIFDLSFFRINSGCSAGALMQRTDGCRGRGTRTARSKDFEDEKISTRAGRALPHSTTLEDDGERHTRRRRDRYCREAWRSTAGSPGSRPRATANATAPGSIASPTRIKL
jgi:hypothetical protein